jgi:C4-dicarboxylate-specific signal transduction histidine kinase
METQHLREDLAHISRVTMANQLAASLAHELRQPLSAVMSNAEAAVLFLSLQPPQLDEVKAALQDIIHDDERASEVIKRLRALYRKTGAEHLDLNLNRLIEETLGLLRSELILQRIASQLNLAPGLETVSGNRVELQQVIMNLVLNAMDAMASTDFEARWLVIETRSNEPGEVQVSVRDAGQGIDPSVAGRLFEPFVTTKASGMGMGLSVSRTIIEAHGGRMWAANNPDRGATFHFALRQKPNLPKP